MISLRDSLILTRTKLKTKRTRQIVTVVVSSLSFGMIIGVTMIISGIDGSVKRFANEQFDGKYYVLATGSGPVGMYVQAYEPTDSAAITRVEQIHKEYVAKRVEVAKRLGMDYDPAAESPAIDVQKDDNGLILYRAVNVESPAAQLYAQELQAKQQPTLSPRARLEASLEGSRAEAISVSTPLNPGMYMPDGKEPLDADSYTNQNVFGSFTYQQSIRDVSYTMIDQSLLAASLLPSNERRQQAGDAIPVVMPVSIAMKAFGTTLGLPAKPTDSDQALAWYKTTQEKLNGVTYSVCYRSSTSQLLIQQAIAQAAEPKMDVTPHYTLPAADSCGPVEVSYANSAEKIATEKQQQLDRETLPSYQEPTQQKITFVIAGLLSQDQDLASNTTLEGFVNSLVGMSTSQGIFIPQQLYYQLPTDRQYATTLMASSTNSPYESSQIVQFGSLEDARTYVMTKNCVDPMTFTFPESCPDAKPFYLSPYGSNYLVIDALVATLKPILGTILIIVIIIAGVIIMAMMGQVIASSRRETAVFRAIGARRIDISKVYILYSLLITARIALAAVLAGTMGALILEVMYGARSTDYARIAFGVINSDARFGYIGTNVYTWMIIGTIFVLGLVAVIPPLLRNVRRNPIRDMRDE